MFLGVRHARQPDLHRELQLPDDLQMDFHIWDRLRLGRATESGAVVYFLPCRQGLPLAHRGELRRESRQSGDRGLARATLPLPAGERRTKLQSARIAFTDVLERIAFLCRVKIDDISGFCAATDATDKLNAIQRRFHHPLMRENSMAIPHFRTSRTG